MEKKDRQVYDLVKSEESLPEIHIPHHQLAKPLMRMEYKAWLARWAMNVGSDVYVYAVWKLLVTVEQAERLKEMFAGGNMPAYAEATYRKLTEAFMAYAEAIPQWVSVKLLADLERTPDLGEGSLLSKLRTWLSEQTKRR